MNKDIYKLLASQGRFGDTELAHINKEEAAMLKAMGGSGTINPNTGLREFAFGYGDSNYGDTAPIEGQLYTDPHGKEYQIQTYYVDENWKGENEYKYYVSGQLFDTLTEAKDWVKNRISNVKVYDQYAGGGDTDYDPEIDFSDLRGDSNWRDTIYNYIVSSKGGAVTDEEAEDIKAKLKDYSIDDIIDVEKEELLSLGYDKDIKDLQTSYKDNVSKLSGEANKFLREAFPDPRSKRHGLKGIKKSFEGLGEGLASDIEGRGLQLESDKETLESGYETTLDTELTDLGFFGD